jgi:hypothetical protein
VRRVIRSGPVQLQHDGGLVLLEKGEGEDKLAAEDGMAGMEHEAQVDLR